MPRVRFAPSPTGFLHIGSARTFIFNWLYARHHRGTMILRIDDTDLDRNTQESLTSIFEGLRWLDLGWDEEHRQSERIELHRRSALAIFEKGWAYRDFTPAEPAVEDKSRSEGAWLCNPGMRDLPRDESDRRAASGEPFVLRFRVPRAQSRTVSFEDAVYGTQNKSADDIEDFALLRSNGLPTYHMASCADDADMGISHIIRGQDHLTNTFKHVLIFEALGVPAPVFGHLPLLIAPDGSKLSKRRHGPVVSVTTYRDAGFLAHAYVNFLCLLGWSPKDDREQMSRQELMEAFSLEGVNRSNAVVNFTEEDPIDPKALWLNAQHLRAMPDEALAAGLLPYLEEANYLVNRQKLLAITPLIRERIRTFREAVPVADFFFLDQLAPYSSSELIPQKGDKAMALTALRHARPLLEAADFEPEALEAVLRDGATQAGLKTGQFFQPVRVAVCGRKNAPPLFETLGVLGRDTCLRRIDEAIGKLEEN